MNEIVAHVDAILGDTEYAELISTKLFADLGRVDISNVIDALAERGYATIWQFETARVYRP